MDFYRASVPKRKDLWHQISIINKITMTDLAIKKKDLEEKIITVLKDIYDPEIPVNIYEIGLIYKIQIDDDFLVHIVMTLTTPNCPVAESLPEEVRQRVKGIEGVKDVDLELTFEPPWDMEMLSDEAKLELGIL
jgi:FeS assembly SUF system protein